MRSILWLPLIAGLWLAGCDSRPVPVTTAPAPAVAPEPAVVPPPVKPPSVKLPAPLHKPQPPSPDVAAVAAPNSQPGPGADVAPPPDGPPAADGPPADGPPAADGAPAPPTDAGSSPAAPDSGDAMLQNPDEVIGLDLAQIARLLGEPAFRTEQPPAKVWSYTGPSCAMRVFVYPDIKSRVFRALTYEIQGTDGSALAKRRCFTTLKKQHAA